MPLLASFLSVLLLPYTAVEDSLGCHQGGFTSPILGKKTCIFRSIVHYVRGGHFFESTKSTKDKGVANWLIYLWLGAEIIRT